jgi:exopolysaccharide transport family protein
MNTVERFPTYQMEPPSEGGPSVGMSIVQIRDFFSREWRLIVGCVVVFMALGAAYAAISPYRYTAYTDMRIDTKGATWTHSDTSGESRPVDDASVESEMETTKSEKVAMNVIDRLNLREDPEFARSGPGRLSRLIAFLTFSTPKPRTVSQAEATRNALDTLKSNLRVTRLGRSYFEQISYTSLDPQKASTIANAIADAYIEDQLQAKFEATRRASVWLEQRIEELRKQASDAYKAVQDFKSQNSIIIGVDGKLASEVELDQLGVALAKARADTSQARAKVERIAGVLEQRSDNKGNLRIPDPVVTDALSNPVITKLRQQFLDDQSKEAEWSSRYGSEHQAAKNLRAEMAGLQRAIWDEISRIAESYKSELQIAKSQEESIDKRMIEVFQKSGATRQSQVRLRELETAANTYRGIYETFLTRFTQSVQQQSFPSTEARIVTLAAPPPAPSSPKTLLIVAFAGVTGFAVSVLTAFARQQMNRQIYTRAQLEKLTGLPCLAVFPSFEQPNAGKAGRLRASMRKPTLDSTAFRQISQVAPFSATAEALRYIKVAIDLHPRNAKVIGIVSALPGEGKTTLAIGFAAFAAKNRARVLVIDADLRNPSMTRSLGYANEPGLVGLVADRASLDDLVIKDTRLNFDFLPSSTQTKPSNSSDMLNSAPIVDLLKEAKSNYDYILIDLPPILPVVDVKAVARLFDAFILVVEWGNTTSDEVVKAISASPISERLIGTILNKADEAVMRRYDGYQDRTLSYYHDDTRALEKA